MLISSSSYYSICQLLFCYHSPLYTVIVDSWIDNSFISLRAHIMLTSSVSCFTETAQQNPVELTASDSFRFGSARGLESQHASSSALRSRQRQHSSLSIFKAHSSSQVTTSGQKKTVSNIVESSAGEQLKTSQFPKQTANQISVAHAATSNGQARERQNPAFRSRTVFTSRTLVPSTTLPPSVPTPREYG